LSVSIQKRIAILPGLQQYPSGTAIEYIQQNYFHYDTKRATGALATGRKGPRIAREDGAILVEERN